MKSTLPRRPGAHDKPRRYLLALSAWLIAVHDLNADARRRLSLWVISRLPILAAVDGAFADVWDCRSPIQDIWALALLYRALRRRRDHTEPRQCLRLCYLSGRLSRNCHRQRSRDSNVLLALKATTSIHVPKLSRCVSVADDVTASFASSCQSAAAGLYDAMAIDTSFMFPYNRLSGERWSYFTPNGVLRTNGR